MKLSPIGEAVLIAREGRRLKAYRDSVGIWTIGVGHTAMAGAPKVAAGLAITAAECDAIFERDVVKYSDPVWNAVNGVPGGPLAQHAFDALVSLCFNIGQSAFLRSSVLKRLKAGDRAGAAEAMLMWNKPAEIVPRRQGEYDQFRTPYETALPKARRNDATRIKLAALVAAVLAPAVQTPVIVPVSPPPLAAAPSWQPDWLAAALAWLDARYGKPAHDPNAIQDAHAA